ncbi:S-methyl-5-thioribose-1-phosphate isomerase [Tissierella carlieri]|uniref:Methylthioribose-1-phosphate isomerase n=1 Tax=Tissierella carlieri TaxID=689904 RepID=A0ABT1S7I5_9FIRM|nr:S-methyl-5-thioribose-1-phosphate isomerase [Tissierella carlieri]MCQ4922428.1 S-methyl-5-thioribose-1-phosphate isomerase [Tissierella carlieri]
MNKIYKLTNEWKEQQLLLPIWFEDGKIRLIDQIKLPFVEEIYTINTVEELAKSIKDMTIRGSGAIGIAGAYGILLAAANSNGDRNYIKESGLLLKSTRPTAVNLMKTVDEMIEAIDNYCGKEVVDFIEEKASEIIERQLGYEKKLGEYGAELINEGDTILTHCHSGALAGAGYGGRALSVIRKAFEQGKNIHVFTSETRPYLQGARITAYELERWGIPHTLITDGMSGYLMKLGRIQKVVVGSDRIAANGDLLNKVGTYMHALAAKKNNIPFYTATSSHTIDYDLAHGMDAHVEYRNEKEVTHLNGQLITEAVTKALYPSFDVTPNELISGIITEKGVMISPYLESLLKVK